MKNLIQQIKEYTEITDTKNEELRANRKGNKHLAFILNGRVDALIENYNKRWAV